MIAFERVSKRYRVGDGWKVLMQDVTLTLPKGRKVGLLGRNGAGKSTLLRMISGAIDPDEGAIVRNARISWPMGFAGGFHGALTGAQNARFIARIYGVNTDVMVDEVSAFAELGDFLYMPVSTYSSGMRARLAFAVSMAVDFDVYLIDEITAVGDHAFRRKCAAAFRRKSATSDLIMVSHSAQTIRDYCDSGLLLENGRMTWYDDVGEALEVYERAMEPATRRDD